MKWIDFSKERPKEEPRRELLVRLTSGRHSVWWSTDRSDAWPHVVTDWCEIEPPSKEPYWASEFREVKIGPPPKPKPDPFEGAKAAAWREYRPPTWNLADHEYFKAGLEAAMKHKEEK